MATDNFTLADEKSFPNGTSVAIYPVSNWPTPDTQRDPSGATPVGSSTASGTVSGGSVTFTGVADGPYWAYALIGSTRVYRSITVSNPLSGPDIPVSAIDVDSTMAANSDQRIPSQKATKTYADTKTAKATLTAKGSIYAASAASTPAELAVGTDGKALLADSSATDGLSYNTLFQTGTHAARLVQAHKAGILFKETDTNLIYLDDGTNWIIWKGDGVVRKTADQTLTQSNTTLQNVTDLLVPIEVNETYFVEAFLFLNAASNSSDFKLGWTGPTGASATWGVVINRGEGVAGGTWVGVAPANGAQGIVTLADPVAVGSASGTTALAIAGVFTADATHAGNIQFQASQNTSTAEDNKVLKNSLLRIRRVA